MSDSKSIVHNMIMLIIAWVMIALLGIPFFDSLEITFNFGIATNIPAITLGPVKIIELMVETKSKLMIAHIKRPKTSPHK